VDRRLGFASHVRADSSSMTVGSSPTRRHRAMNAKLSTMPNDLSTSDPGPGIPIPVPEPPGPDLVPDPAPQTDPRPPDTQPSPDPQLPPDPRLLPRLDREEIAVGKHGLEGPDLGHDERRLLPRQVANHVGDEHAARVQLLPGEGKELLRGEVRRDGEKRIVDVTEDQIVLPRCIAQEAAAFRDQPGPLRGETRERITAINEREKSAASGSRGGRFIASSSSVSASKTNEQTGSITISRKAM